MPGRGFGWLLFAAGLTAALTARPYAGGWNDGSRLAAVESLAARSTFRIDESIYVTVPPQSPYTPGDAGLARYGTGDKLRIDGRFYSDKSPVPAVIMAGAYRVGRLIGLPSAAERPDLFARVLTWLFAGVPYVLAVWCVGRTIGRIRLPGRWALGLTAGFAFGLALPYTQHVNNHVLLLAVGAAACDLMVRRASLNRTRAAGLGVLAGLGYAIDLGAGPPLLMATLGFVFWTGGVNRRSLVACFGLGALPVVAAHHAMNYAIAGTLTPANAHAEFFRWPGSPFTAATMTGGWNHPSLATAGLYALDLLGGKKGLLLYAPPLVLVLTGVVRLLGRPTRERPVLAALYAWCAATWLIYAATSRNLSGVCLSVRWFLPLLAPGFVALAVLVRESPGRRSGLLVLLVGGFLLTPEFVWRGPWSARIPWTFWPVVGLTLTVWGVLAGQRLLRVSRVIRLRATVGRVTARVPRALSSAGTPG
jgi:hypothetical protein